MFRTSIWTLISDFSRCGDVRRPLSWGVAALILLTLSAAAQSESRYAELDVPFIVNGNERGVIGVRIAVTGSSEVAVETDVLIDVLVESLAPSVLDRFLNTCTHCRWTSLALLSTEGIPVVFDRSTLTVSLNVPPELRPLRVLPLRGGREGTPKHYVPQADISSYVNFGVDVGLVYAEQGVNVPHSLDASGVLNIHGWVLEGSLVAESDETGRNLSIEPSTLRATRDLRGAGVRIAVGDLSTALRGYQQSVSMRGVSISRLPVLDPVGEPWTVRGTEFVLPEPSRVQFSVDDGTIRSLSLPAGTYALSDIGLTTGIHEVSVTYETESGESGARSFIVPFSGRALPPGTNLYSAAFGVPTEEARAPIVSLYGLNGISQGLTTGAHAQISAQAQLFGFESILASRIGTLSLSGGVSHTPYVGPGFAVEGIYRYVDNRRRVSPTLLFSFLSQTRRFTGVHDPRPDNPTSLTVAGGIGLDIPSVAGLSFGAERRWYRDDRRGVTRLTGTIGVSFPGASSLRAQGAVNLGRGSTVDWSISVGMSAQASTGASGVSFEQDLGEQEGELRVSVRPSTDVGDMSLTARLAGFPLETGRDRSVGGSASYLHPRFESTVSGSISGSGVTRFDAGASAAVVFAGGHFGVSAPITDSFALFPIDESAESLFVGINPRGGRYAASRDALGAPVLHKLTSYKARSLFIDVPELPIGDELSISQPVLYPGYKSGTVVAVDVIRSVYVEGVLVDDTGVPIPLVYGIAEAVSEPDGDDGSTEQVHPFFSDARGAFVVYGLSSSTDYLLSFPGTDYAPARIRIDQDQGRVDIGNLEIRTTEVTP